jgi:hypothetical protein
MTSFQIVGQRTPWNSLKLCARDDFELGPARSGAASAIRERDVAPYSIDWTSKTVYWVRLSDVQSALSEAFWFMGMRKVATELIASSFDETLAELADLPFDDSNLAIMFNTGRCGSTLMTRLVQTSDKCVTFSEPDWITPSRAHTDADSLKVIATVARAHGRFLNPGQKVIFFKCRGMTTDFISQLGGAMPRARSLFMFRDLEATVRSAIALPSVFNSLEEVWQRMPYPDLKERLSPELKASLKHPWGELISVFGLLRAGQASKVCSLKTITYEDMTADPVGLLTRFLALFGVECSPVTSIQQVMSRDSQEGTELSGRQGPRASLRPDYYQSVVKCFPELPEVIEQLQALRV